MAAGSKLLWFTVGFDRPVEVQLKGKRTAGQVELSIDSMRQDLYSQKPRASSSLAKGILVLAEVARHD